MPLKTQPCDCHLRG